MSRGFPPVRYGLHPSTDDMLNQVQESRWQDGQDAEHPQTPFGLGLLLDLGKCEQVSHEQKMKILVI